MKRLILLLWEHSTRGDYFTTKQISMAVKKTKELTNQQIDRRIEQIKKGKQKNNIELYILKKQKEINKLKKDIDDVLND